MRAEKLRRSVDDIDNRRCTTMKTRRFAQYALGGLRGVAACGSRLQRLEQRQSRRRREAGAGRAHIRKRVRNQFKKGDPMKIKLGKGACCIATAPAARLFVLVTCLAAFALGALPAGATVPGTNGKIVFAQDPLGSFTIDPDGTDPHQIGPVGSTFCTTWSPDSSKVLCQLFSEEGVQPATANPDGSGFTLLNPPLVLFCLNWSPDGSRLLCHTGEGADPAEAGLYTVRSSDAGDLVRVTADPPNGFDSPYGYSPDGSRILYAQFTDEQGTLFSVKPDGSDPVQLSPPALSVIDLDFFDRIGADWAPDSSRVAFAAFDQSSRRTGLFVVAADGSGLRLVTPSGIGALSAQWSPNGDLIAFTSCISSRNCRIPQAWVVHPDGTGLRQVTPPVNGDVFWTPVWSPDSTKLLLDRVDLHSGQTSLWTVNTDGSGLSKLADTTSHSSYAWGSAPAE
jgi:Tol biopolymer transport system component